MGNKVYSIITEKICELLDQGVIPWKPEWNATAGMPQNFDSKRPYSGFNRLYLSLMQRIQSWQYPYFLTFNGAKKHGWHIRKGETGNIVVFWRLYRKKVRNALTSEEEEKQVRVLRYYYLFNLAQIEGWTETDLPELTSNKKLPTADELMQQFRPDLPVINVGSNPMYIPSIDKIYIPPITSFSSVEHWYNAVFHETVHSTGSKHRLARPGVAKSAHFGTEEYSLEELIAEIGAAFIDSMAGISAEVIKHNAAYVQAWKAKLSENPTWIVKASSQAQKAVDYILTV